MEPTLVPPDLDGLDAFLDAGPYVSYVYSYPHKTAYRELPTPRRLADVWRDERRESLFLYLHVPFCEMRCGFCNLFTLSQPEQSLPDAYLQTVQRQAASIAEAIGSRRFARLAIGGGTPTFLSTPQLERLFATLIDVMKARPADVPVSIETSPATIDGAKAELLHAVGVDRVSMGVQSWDAADVGQMGRPQREQEVVAALDCLRKQGFKTLNLDLIYGAEGQTAASWSATLRRTLSYRPEEIYLYPLYVRPLTGLGKQARDASDQRLALYRLGRDLLLEAGYVQTSMRMFHLPNVGEEGPVYCCQEDGMIGLGCGARSYTQSLHYADEFAVRQSSVHEILQRYVDLPSTAWERVSRGIELDEDEQRRRYLIISLLTAEGLAVEDYRARFGQSPLDDFPELNQLVQRGLAELAASELTGESKGESRRRLRLTAAGLEQSDAIGPWLYSARVRRRMEAFPWNAA